MHYKTIKLSDVWRTCNKIRSAIFRVNLNLWDHYLPLDPEKNCVISESKFCSVLSGPLKSVIGLSEQEIADLADYFRVQDGRILYTQFCEVIQNNIPNFSTNKPLVTGLEWEDPMQVNRLSITEERRLNLLITKMAVQVNMKKLVLKPYFQDYELVSKNVGTVTIAHFARILTYLGILVSAEDFNLLVKKYLKDSYTLNYVAFIAAIDASVDYMDKHGMLDLGGDLHAQFPGRLIDAELPKLPRPEIGKILAASIFGKQTTFHPALEIPKQSQDLITIMRTIQKHIISNRLRVNEFFRDFDPLHTGKVTVSQFHRGLDALGISCTNKLFLSLPEIEAIMVQYRDPSDPMRVCWKTFEDDVDQVFTVKELEKCPCLDVISPPRAVSELPQKGGKVWQQVSSQTRDLCEEALMKVKHRTMKRAIMLKPLFGDYDTHNNGHVTRSQMRQCISSNGILLSGEELYALEERFNDDLGFNYFWFLREVEPKRHELPLFTGFISDMKKLNAPKPPKPVERNEKDIVMVLAKIKSKVVRERIRLLEFLRDFDRHNEEVMSRQDFKRAIDNCKLDLTEGEFETLFEVFGSIKRCDCVDYKRFENVVEEAFTQSCLDRAPLIMPIQHVPTNDCERNFLNFEERKTMCIALQKLAKKPEQEMNLMAVLEDFDRTKCGTVSQQQLLKTLAVRGMMNMISRSEFDIICKGFGFRRGLRDEVDYRAFIKALDILYATNKYLPF
ncbi:hypothetical protein PPYR_03916 [Photinus pyralis]|uniref:EF-hand domain-containing protein n=2 Tax=Photinus pyralis TaxID=7054 RepID=A0A5N4AWW3_PHOPY|nr:uncharacterized protein LOC116164262 [Photinus pyralis]KAB0801730.1 hypothetical protein PPYR_03916 [Photinus pyralis]